MSRTLTEAAAAYCAQREEILALTARIGAAGECENFYRGSSLADDPGDPRCVDLAPDGTPWWQLKPDQLAEMCQSCQTKVPLWRERYAMKRRLAGLMRSMCEAYRRETRPSQDRRKR